jgi:hypothetical protein
MGLFDIFRFKDPVEKLVHDVVKIFKVQRVTSESDLLAAFCCLYWRYTDEGMRQKIIDRMEKRCKDGDLIGLWHVCTDFACVEFADLHKSDFQFMQATAHDLQKMGIAEDILDGRVYSIAEFRSALNNTKIF